ncbi:MAG: Hpt domain-containing protein [Planctomycetota bacterium]
MIPDFDPELVEMFVEDVPERIEQIESAVQAGDREALARFGHQLKGAAAGFGFPKITEAAAVVERACKDGGTDDAAVVIATRELLRLLNEALDFGSSAQAA